MENIFRNGILRALNYTGNHATLKPAYDDYLAFLFMDWRDNFSTLDSFANYYGLEKDQANEVIETGRKIHSEWIRMRKENIISEEIFCDT